MAETKKKSTTGKKKTTKKATESTVTKVEEVNTVTTPIVEGIVEEPKEEVVVEKPKKDETYELLLAKIADLEAKLAEKSNAVLIVQYANDTEMVELLWQAPVSDDNIVTFGDNGAYGRITGKTGVFYVPKREMPRILDNITNTFLKKRWLIVLNGLSDEERANIGVDYKEGEVLDRKAFSNMLDLDDDILAIYPKLCVGHKEIVEKCFYEEFKKNNKRFPRERISELNKLAQKSGRRQNGFATILEEMNAQEIAE